MLQLESGSLLTRGGSSIPQKHSALQIHVRNMNFCAFGNFAIIEKVKTVSYEYSTPAYGYPDCRHMKAHRSGELLPL